jgi:hypothetical protein
VLPAKERSALQIEICDCDRRPDYQPNAWRRKLARPIVLKDGTKLATLSDARAFVLARPGNVQGEKAWKRAAGLLLEAAQDSRRVEAATTEIEHALFLQGLWVPTTERRSTDEKKRAFDASGAAVLELCGAA